MAHSLRGLVMRAVPGVTERLRPGWRLIGYDVPVGRSSRYFAYVAPETDHVHLGFEHGALMSDPDTLLEGAHLGLRKVRYLTFRPNDQIPDAVVMTLVREAAAIAASSRAERSSLALLRG